HLLAFNKQELGVNPEMDERLAGCAFRLRYLVFVVREDQINASAVDVEGLPEILHRHGRAFEVPAGTTLAKRGRPTRLAFFFGRLPQNKVASVSLVVLVDVDSGARDISFKLQARELAVAGERRDAEVQ